MQDESWQHSEAQRAQHEASHAVIFWWWAKREDAPAHLSGTFDLVSLEPVQGFPHGRFVPGDHTRWELHEMADLVDQIAAAFIAGPVSDERQGREWPGAGAFDVRKAQAFAALHPVYKSGGVSISRYLDGVRREVSELLALEDVDSMVQAFAKHLERERTIRGHEAAAWLSAWIDRPPPSPLTHS